LNINKTVNSCRKYLNFECLTYIARNNQDYSTAYDAIENILLDFTELENNNILCTNETQLCDYPQLLPYLSAVEIANELLQISKKKEFCYVFDFPIYHVRSKPKNVQTTLLTLYTHFLMNAFKAINVSEQFPIIIRNISSFQNTDSKTLIRQILIELEYQKTINNCLFDLCVEDTQNIIKKANIHFSKSVTSNSITECSTCNQLISKSSEILLFPCGHMFHNNQHCCLSTQYCSLCQTGSIPDSAPASSFKPKLTQRRIQQLMRRMDFALKRNYGSDVQKISVLSAFFPKQNKCICDEIIPVDDIPSSIPEPDPISAIKII